MTASTVLILGAGAVRALGARRPTARRPPLDCDFFEIARKVDANLHEEVCSQLREAVGSYSRVALGSLEVTTTLLYLKALDSHAGSVSHGAFLSQLRLIERTLAATTNDLRVGPRSPLYRLIRRELRRAQNAEKLTIITFNYDIVIERVLAELHAHCQGPAFSFPQCYNLPRGTPIRGLTGGDPFNAPGTPEPTIKLLKLHGSMNWQSSHNSERPTPSALFNTKRELTVLNHKKVVFALKRRSRRLTYLQPIIVPPIAGKRGIMHCALLPVWSEASRELRRAERIVVFGYSCPPLDFEAKVLLSENTPETVLKDLIVIDPNPEVAARFISVCGAKGAAVYTSLEAFFHDDTGVQGVEAEHR